ncbi:MAG: gliding motility protein GldL [Prevotella sp.]|nr:gliding motility protein GldL [Prevotella sp.]
MTQYSKYNIVYRLQKWMDSVPGQTFLNYGYSWGASVVILGALFKLTHLPGANIMLYFGMGTEVIVFFLSAFDRPFDKTDDGKELPTHVTEEYLEGVDSPALQSVRKDAASVPSSLAGVDGAVQASIPTANDIAAAVVSQQGKVIADAQQQTPEMVEAQTNYVDALKNLTDMLGKVSDQSQRLTRDSEEMENLNRTLTGIAKVYEMQLKGASQQIGTIDQINDQTRKMAQQIEQLNKIYARMIEAMTVNMRVAAPGAASQQSASESL